MPFDFQPTVSDDELLARPLREADRAALNGAAADPMIWAGHPARDRHEAPVFNRYFDILLASGSALVVQERGTGRTIGCSRFYVAPDTPEAISIGFTFLIRDHWGGDTNARLKALMLRPVFAAGKEAWFHIDPNNIRSQRATLKLGARHAYDATLNLGTGEAEWMCFRLTEEQWRAAQDLPL